MLKYKTRPTIPPFLENPVLATFHNVPVQTLQQPESPEERAKALKGRGFEVNLKTRAQLDSRRQAELEMKGWHGKHKK